MLKGGGKKVNRTGGNASAPQIASKNKWAKGYTQRKKNLRTGAFKDVGKISEGTGNYV